MDTSVPVACLLGPDSPQVNFAHPNETAVTAGAEPNYTAAFATVTTPALTASASESRPPVTDTERVAEFIDCCDSVIGIVVDQLPVTDLLPGVEVKPPAAVLKAYLLFLACEAPHEDEGDRLANWYERVTSTVWKLLGFDRRPSLLTLELAFSLLTHPDHHAPELRALVLAVRFFGGADLLRGLSA